MPPDVLTVTEESLLDIAAHLFTGLLHHEEHPEAVTDLWMRTCIEDELVCTPFSYMAKLTGTSDFGGQSLQGRAA
jgi:hypothetical protein